MTTRNLIRRATFNPRSNVLDKVLSPSKKRRAIITKGSIIFSETGICLLRIPSNKGNSVFILTPRDTKAKKQPNVKPLTKRRLGKKCNLVFNLNRGKLFVIKSKGKAVVKPKAKPPAPKKNSIKSIYKKTDDNLNKDVKKNKTVSRKIYR